MWSRSVGLSGFLKKVCLFCLGLGINAKRNSKGDKESPRKIPHLISTSSNSEFSAQDITLHFFILLTNKFLIFSATPNNSKHSLIYECGTIL